jgi:hypothetical protein
LGYSDSFIEERKVIRQQKDEVAQDQTGGKRSQDHGVGRRFLRGQGAIDDAMAKQRNERSHHKGQPQYEYGVGRKTQRNQQGRVRANGDQLSMGKVGQLDHGQRQRQADRHQRVQAAALHGTNQSIKQKRGGQRINSYTVLRIRS